MSKAGNEILLRARSQFRATRTVESLQKIPVPEWGTEVYYWPEMSVDEKRAVYRHLRTGDNGLEISADAMLSAAVTQVCIRARDAFGERLFSDDQEEDLRDTSPDVLQRISNEMGWGARASLEDAEKN